MNDTGQSPSLPDSAFILYHQHVAYGGSPLETLPEEDGDNEEECQSESEPSSASWPGTHSESNDSGIVAKRKGMAVESKSGSDISQPITIRGEIESQRAKVQILEAAIRTLREELRESKDQNELLEFRLLELEEFESSSPRNQVDCEIRKRCNGRKMLSSEEDVGVEGLVLGNETSQVRLYDVEDGAEVSSEVTNHEESSSNGHSSVAEARSSCSDCSESLSFQESGIFENQYTEDTYAYGRGSQEDLSQELARLISQIETLVQRFCGDESGDLKIGDGIEVKGNEPKIIRPGKVHLRHRNDFSYEFLICRQRIQEFEHKLSKFGNVHYVQSLEDKISLLMEESQKLEEEKAEMEEAENDSRNHSQRLEEKVRQVKEKKAVLQHQLSNERRVLEQLRIQVLQFQEHEDELLNQITRLEAHLQTHEQRNFELEESYIEVKDSIQFLLFCIPVCLVWVLWSFQQFQKISFQQLPQLLPKESLQPNEKKVEKFREEPRDVECKKRRDIGLQTTHELCLDELFLFKTGWTPVEIELRQEIKNLVSRKVRVLVEGYERKLREKESILDSCRQELKVVQEKWETLIKELEAFEVDNKKTTPHDTQTGPIQKHVGVKNSCSKLRHGSLVANRIRSLFSENVESTRSKLIDFFPPPLPMTRPPLPPRSLGKTPSYITLQLQQKVLDHLQKYEEKQKVLEAEIDGLKSTRLEKESIDNQEKEILHLKEENKRLSQLLQEQEGLWTRIGKLDEENEGLRDDLMMTQDLEKKIDEAQGVGKRLMNRVEELEQNEIIWKERQMEAERSERKTKESLNYLRNEIQTMRERCCHLQDEVEGKNKVIEEQKHESLSLSLRFKEQNSIIQDKENIFHESELLFCGKISKLEIGLEEAQQELGDLECSNGMLREEVIYFERTLAEVTELGDRNEKIIQIQTSKLQMQEDQISELKKELSEAKNRHRGLPSNNDLDGLARHDGGLIGVAREVKEVMALLNPCVVCKLAVGGKLNEISEQLTTLTLMLEGSQDLNSVFWTEGEEERSLSLSRCESEEHLSSTPSASIGSKAFSSGGGRPSSACRCHVEGNKNLRSNLALLEREFLKKEVEVAELHEKRGILSAQLKGLEEISAHREKELRESHLNESWWWKLRCEEKNELIQILARRIVHLSASDVQGGHFLEGILREIHKVAQSYPRVVSGNLPSTTGEDLPLDSSSLLNYFNTERRRIENILETSTPAEMHVDPSLCQNMDFRVLRRVGDDALLVSWCVNPSKLSLDSFDGYEISVNGETYLRILNPNRCKAFLFGLNMTKPLQLSLKLRSEGVVSSQESSITYIA